MLQLPSPALCPFFVTSRFNLLRTLLVLVPLLPLYCSSSPCSSQLTLLSCPYCKQDLCFGGWLLFHLLISQWIRRPIVMSLCCCPVFTFNHPLLSPKMSWGPDLLWTWAKPAVPPFTLHGPAVVCRPLLGNHWAKICQEKKVWKDTNHKNTTL